MQFGTLAWVSSCCDDIVLRISELGKKSGVSYFPFELWGLGLTSSSTKASPSPRELPVTKKEGIGDMGRKLLRVEDEELIVALS